MDFNGDLIVLGSQAGSPELTNLGDSTDTNGQGTGTKGTLTWPSGFKIQWDTVELTSDENSNFALPEAYTGANLVNICCYATNILDTANQSSLSIRQGSVTPLDTVQIKQNAEATESVAFLSFGFDV